MLNLKNLAMKKKEKNPINPQIVMHLTLLSLCSIKFPVI